MLLLGKFGITKKKNEHIILTCVGSSYFSGAQGKCLASIKIPKNADGTLDFTNAVNYIVMKSNGNGNSSGSNSDSFRQHFHHPNCPCLLMNDLNVQNYLMTDLNKFASASVVFPRMDEFSTSREPFHTITPSMDKIRNILTVSNSTFTTFIVQTMEVGLIPLWEMIVSAFTGGYLGSTNKETLKGTIRRDLVTISDSQLTNAPAAIKSLMGYNVMKSPPLLWNPVRWGVKIQNDMERLEICRGACRLLFAAISNFLKQLGVVSFMFSQPNYYLITHPHIKLIYIQSLFDSIIEYRCRKFTRFYLP